jgi:hypothetical protein
MGASILIGMHGAGLTNALLMKTHPTPHIIEVSDFKVSLLHKLIVMVRSCRFVTSIISVHTTLCVFTYYTGDAIPVS